LKRERERQGRRQRKVGNAKCKVLLLQSIKKQ
jgi:hypothetical protein